MEKILGFIVIAGGLTSVLTAFDLADWKIDSPLTSLILDEERVSEFFALSPEEVTQQLVAFSTASAVIASIGAVIFLSKPIK